jgi:hypothetical protein
MRTWLITVAGGLQHSGKSTGTLTDVRYELRFPARVQVAAGSDRRQGAIWRAELDKGEDECGVLDRVVGPGRTKMANGYPVTIARAWLLRR